MAARETTYKGKLGEWERLTAMLNASATDLGHLQVMRGQLASLLSQAQDASSRQAVHTVAKQEASQEIQTLIVEGDRLVSLLRAAVKQHYGVESEKLAQFGLQPFRGRKRKKSSEEPLPPSVEVTPPAPADPSN